MFYFSNESGDKNDDKKRRNPFPKFHNRLHGGKNRQFVINLLPQSSIPTQFFIVRMVLWAQSWCRMPTLWRHTTLWRMCWRHPPSIILTKFINFLTPHILEWRLRTAPCRMTGCVITVYSEYWVYCTGINFYFLELRWKHY